MVKKQMMSKKEKSIQFLKENCGDFACPLCKGIMAVDEPFFRCGNGHNFTISHKGVLVLAHTSQLKKSRIYDRSLFYSRRQFVHGGYYQEAYSMINRFISGCGEWPHNGSGLILDLGCGEGSHDEWIRKGLQQHPHRLIGLDLSKDAIEMATDYFDNDSFFFVGDVTNIPLKDESVSVALDFLSPYYSVETNRVLRKNGLFIKVVPGRNYLKELRDVSGLKAYTGYTAMERIDGGITLVEKRSVYSEFPLKPDERLWAYHMTPMTKNAIISTDEVLERLKQISIDLDIFCYRKA